MKQSVLIPKTNPVKFFPNYANIDYTSEVPLVDICRAICDSLKVDEIYAAAYDGDWWEDFRPQMDLTKVDSFESLLEFGNKYFGLHRCYFSGKYSDGEVFNIVVRFDESKLISMTSTNCDTLYSIKNTIECHILNPDEEKYIPTCPRGYCDCVNDPNYLIYAHNHYMSEEEYQEMINDCKKRAKDDPDEKYHCYDNEDK